MGARQSTGEKNIDESFRRKSYVESLLQIQHKSILKSNSRENKEVILVRKERTLSVLNERKFIKPYALHLLEVRASTIERPPPFPDSIVSQKDPTTKKTALKGPDKQQTNPKEVMVRVASHRKNSKKVNFSVISTPSLATRKSTTILNQPQIHYASTQSAMSTSSFSTESEESMNQLIIGANEELPKLKSEVSSRKTILLQMPSTPADRESTPTSFPHYRPSTPPQRQPTPKSSTPDRPSSPYQRQPPPKFSTPDRPSSPYQRQPPPKFTTPDRPSSPYQRQPPPKFSTPDRPSSPYQRQPPPKSSTPDRPSSPYQRQPPPKSSTPDRPSSPYQRQPPPKSVTPDRSSPVSHKQPNPKHTANNLPSIHSQRANWKSFGTAYPKSGSLFDSNSILSLPSTGDLMETTDSLEDMKETHLERESHYLEAQMYYGFRDPEARSNPMSSQLSERGGFSNRRDRELLLSKKPTVEYDSDDSYDRRRRVEVDRRTDSMIANWRTPKSSAELLGVDEKDLFLLAYREKNNLKPVPHQPIRKEREYQQRCHDIPDYRVTDLTERYSLLSWDKVGSARHSWDSSCRSRCRRHRPK